MSWHLKVWSTYAASVDEVWSLKTDVRALADEFRPFLRMAVDDPEGLQRALRGQAPAGFKSKVSGPLGLLKMRWPMQIVHSSPPRAYEDHSVNGAYLRWEHQHRVQPVNDLLTRYVDEVWFDPAGRLGWLSAEILRMSFLHRHRRTARRLVQDPTEPTQSLLVRESRLVAWSFA